MSTTSAVVTLVFCVVYIASSLLAFAGRDTKSGRMEAVGYPQKDRSLAMRNELHELLRCTLFFWLLFIPAVAATLLVTVLFLLSPTLSDAVPPAITAALTLHLAAARWGEKHAEKDAEKVTATTYREGRGNE